MSGDSEPPAALLRRASSASTLGWPADVDLDAWYAAERRDADDAVRNAQDLSVWSLETKREHVSVFAHCKNNEKLSYSVRAVAKVAGSVAGVMECLRATENVPFRGFQKLLHTKTFADGEVLHAHHRRNATSESLSLKWMTFWATKTLGKGKEVCVREYCTLLPTHPSVFGPVGVCCFASYDGVGARYAIRSKPDAYSLTVVEPSAFVVQQTAEDGIVSVTLTLVMRKARGDGVTTGIKQLAFRLALDLAVLQRAMQHTLFQPGQLAAKKQWVSDDARTNCSLCVQSFGMLKRRHHCRVCGEVVCSTCTVFKHVNNNNDTHDALVAKVRVCKACLAKSSTSMTDLSGVMVPYHHSHHPTNTSICSVSSGVSSSDESRGSNDDTTAATITPLAPQPPVHQPQYQYPPQYQYSPQYQYPTPSTYSKASTASSSFSDYDVNPDANGSASPSVEKTQLLPPSMHKTLTTWNSSSPPAAPSTTSARSGPPPTGSTRSLRSGSEQHQRRINYFNEDFEEICMLAMETLQCPMAGIRTDDFELVRYYEGKAPPGLPRSLPTFRRIASRGKPCIVLDVSSDKRISGEKRFAAKLQFFVGIPLMADGEVIGDLCVADRFARDTIDFKQVEVLSVLGTTVTQYMQSHDYMEDLAMFKSMRRNQVAGTTDSGSYGRPGGAVVDGANGVHVKEVAF